MSTYVSVFVEGLGVGGGIFWLLNEAWPSRVLQHCKQ